MATPQTFVATTIGRVAIPKLADTLVKTGADKFVKQYGQKAFEAVLGTSIGARAYSKTEEYITEYLNHIDTGGDEESFVPKGSMPTATRSDQMDAVMAVPNKTPFAGDLKVPGVIVPDAGEIERENERFRELEKKRLRGTPPPEIPLTTGETTPPKIETTEEFPIEEQLPDTLSTPIPEPEGPQIYYNKDADDVNTQTENLVRGIGDNNPPSSIEEETTVLKTKPREYKGKITETTSLNENLKEAIAKYAGTPEDIAKSLKMPQSHKRKIYIQLEEYLNENYPSKLNEKEQEVESDALFYIANSVYDIYTYRGEGGMPRDTLMVQDDIGFPLATAEIERYPKGKLNYYPRRKKGNKYVRTEPAVYIETIGGLNKDATSNILDQIEKIAESEDVRYIVAEDLTSEAAAKALEKRGFVPAKKGFFEGDIINEADWRGGKKNVKQKNMVLDLGEKYRTTEKEIQEEFVKEQTDNLLKNK